MKRLALVALCGCNSILGVGEFKTSDAGTGDTPDANPSSVTGTSIVSHILFDGSIETAPEDLSGYTIKAYLPNGDGTFMTRDGVGDDQGRFVIPDVPDGPYLLYLLYPEVPNHPEPFPWVYATDARTLDLGYHVMGRADGIEATQASTVTLNLTNMASWSPNDTLLVNSYNNGSEFGDMSSMTNAPSVDDTAVSGASFDWRNGYTYHPVGSLPRLIQASEGDDLFVIHHREQTVHVDGLWRYRYVTEAGMSFVDDLEQTDGAPLVVNGTFTPITPDETVHVVVPMIDYRADYAAADNGDGFAEAMTVSRLDNVGVQYGQRIGSGPWGVTVGQPFFFEPVRGVPDVIDVTLSYGESSLLPSSWGQVAALTYYRRRRVAAPGATATALLEFSGFTINASATIDGGPRIRPVTEISVDGVDVLANGGAVAFDGTHGVTVTWENVAAADRYEVAVQRVYADAGVSIREDTFRLVTTETSVGIPPDLFVRGERYAIAVTTRSGVDETGFRRATQTNALARIYGDLFLFSDACGDGVTQTELGEECDTRGQTATCDADCSFPVCRDGYHNDAAGEACDHGGYSFGCDDDCTLISCGDANHNPVAEDCDDGDTADDGNGCSATCERVGSCGDATLQGFFEACDPPDGTNCGPDCQAL